MKLSLIPKFLLNFKFACIYVYAHVRVWVYACECR